MNSPPHSSGPDAPTLHDALLLARREVDARKPSNRWHPSTIGFCKRRQVLERAGLPPRRVPSIEDLRRFDGGSVFHRQVRDDLAEAGVLMLPEVGTQCPACGHTVGKDGHKSDEFHLADNGLQLSGWADAVIGHQYAETDDERLKAIRKALALELGDPAPAVYEVKSVRPGAIHKAATRGATPHHLMQLGAMFLLYEAHPEQLPVYPTVWELLLVPMSEDTFQGRFPNWARIPLPERVIDKTKRVVDDLNAAWEAGSLPDCSCSGPYAREITRGRERMGPWCVYADPNGGQCCQAQDWEKRRAA